jgi:SPP1 family holin
MAQPIKKTAILRTLFLAAALLNQVLVSVGKSPLPLDEANTELVFSLVWTGVASVMAWWKDNDFTKQARENKQKIKASK